MCEESVFYQKLSSCYILKSWEYEDPNRVFPVKDEQRKLMRTCRRCGLLHDINFPAGKCTFHRSFFRVTLPEAGLGLVIGRGGSNLKEIQKVSKVSRMTVSRDNWGRFRGEIQLQGGGNEVDHALSKISIRIVFGSCLLISCISHLFQSYFQVGRAFTMIRQKLYIVGHVDGTWDCCNKKIGCKDCAEEMNHDSLFRECFLDNSLVIRAH